MYTYTYIYTYTYTYMHTYIHRARCAPVSCKRRVPAQQAAPLRTFRLHMCVCMYIIYVCVCISYMCVYVYLMCVCVCISEVRVYVYQSNHSHQHRYARRSLFFCLVRLIAHALAVPDGGTGALLPGPPTHCGSAYSTECVLSYRICSLAAVRTVHMSLRRRYCVANVLLMCC
jgi:hypothetical protein